MREEFEELKEAPNTEENTETPVEKESDEINDRDKTWGKSRASDSFFSGTVLPAVKKVLDKNSMSGLIITLTVIAVVAALALGFVYKQTAPVISSFMKQETDEAMRKVLPSENFEVSSIAPNVYEGRAADGTLDGFTVEVSPSGYGGKISMIVGIDLNGLVTGVVIISHSETPGIGTRAVSEDWFLKQYKGRGGSLEMGRGGIDALSGATITSKAVNEGIREALQTVLSGLNE